MPVGEVETAYAARPEGSQSKLSTFRDGWRILKTIVTLYRIERPVLFYGAIGALLLRRADPRAVPLVLTYLADRPGAALPDRDPRHRNGDHRRAVLLRRADPRHRHARPPRDPAPRLSRRFPRPGVAVDRNASPDRELCRLGDRSGFRTDQPRRLRLFHDPFQRRRTNRGAYMIRTNTALRAGVAFAALIGGASAARRKARCRRPTSARPRASRGSPPRPEGEIVITGSRIRRNPLDLDAPRVFLDQQDIAKTGLNSINDVLQRLPSSGGGLNRKFNNSGNLGNPPDGGGVGAGSAEIDLRYLGSRRTLVLVDGLRFVNGASASGVPRLGRPQHHSRKHDRARRSPAGRRVGDLRFGRDRRRRQHHHQAAPEGLRGLGAARRLLAAGRRQDPELPAELGQRRRRTGCRSSSAAIM